jgi:Fe2+ transport system protein FeoA
MEASFNFGAGRAQSRPLSELPEGAGGRVVSVAASAGDLERLEVMGLCQGRLVQVVKHGDPMIVRVLGTRIGLATAVARAILVRRDPEPTGLG